MKTIQMGICILALLSFSACNSEISSNELFFENRVLLESHPETDKNVYGGNIFTTIDGRNYFEKGATIKISSKYSDGAFNIWMTDFSNGVIHLQYEDTEIFDTYEESGLPKDDNILPKYENDPDMQFMLIHMNVTNESISLSNDPDEDFNISSFVLAYVGQLSESEMFEQTNNWNPQIAYFSEHGFDSKYYHFRIEQGDSKEIKIGFFAPKQLIANKELALRIGPGTERRFFFDILEIVNH